MSSGCAAFEKSDTSSLSGTDVALTGGQIGTGFGRAGRRGVRLNSASAVITPKWGASQQLYLGIGFRTESPAPLASDFATIAFISAAGTQVTFRFYGDGKVEVYRGASAALLESAPAGSFFSKIMRQLVLKCKVSATVGEVMARVGTNTLFNTGSLNTLGAGAVEEITQIVINDGSFAEVWFVDPWWSDDTDHGTKAVLTQRLVADGDYGVGSGFTPSSGSDLTAMINETIASGSDTTKISANSAGARHSHSVQALASNVTGIALVQPCLWGNVDDASSRTLEGFTRSGANNDGDAPALPVSHTPAWHVFPMLTDLADGGAWTTTKFNEAGREFGSHLAS